MSARSRGTLCRGVPHVSPHLRDVGTTDPSAPSETSRGSWKGTTSVVPEKRHHPIGLSRWGRLSHPCHSELQDMTKEVRELISSPQRKLS